VQRGSVADDAADRGQGDQPVGGGPQLQHVPLGVGIPGGAQQADEDVADGLAGTRVPPTPYISW
jgi:hypothetical protein